MYRFKNSFKKLRGFSLIELITVMILLSVVSIVLFSRIGLVGTAPIQSSRDDLIAALFFAQQQAMMRASSNTFIELEITSTAIQVAETVGTGSPRALYSVTIPNGVAVTPSTFAYDKLGRTSPGTITLTGSGNSSGVTARVRVEASGYAFAN